MSDSDRGTSCFIEVADYDLEGTLNSGQAFRWLPFESGWAAVLGSRWVHLEQRRTGISVHTFQPVTDWSWAAEYLQTKEDLGAILNTFPADAPMQAAVAACRGLRILRQDPWECLASFILSSTKRITHIRQIVSQLCERFGTPVQAPVAFGPAWSFPTPGRLASETETALRCCKMGFRAPYLLEAAKAVASGSLSLEDLTALPLEEARARLTELPGVGTKIANCVLLFSLGFKMAFPVDVWVMKGLRQLYFPRRRPKPQRIRNFAENYFGPNSGYAQQYLFHYMRVRRPALKDRPSDP